ncbi:hypothetical protein HJC23_006399 [Cyclotella cryptica]|uniref:Uncharacterized protein n=1 Tax=Cyclotella cryptica TaxID=29204 RepID=A0ABD3QUU1_9STRA
MMGSNNNNPSELDLIKKECSEMIAVLKELHEEETNLRKENEILAQQAVLAGSKGGLDGAKKKGRKKPAPASKKTEDLKSTGENDGS